MALSYLEPRKINEFVQNILQEDIGADDFTTLSTIDKTVFGKAKLIIKEDGIIAGIKFAENFYRIYDKNLHLEIFLKDGSNIKKGDIPFIVSGSIASILSSERIVLNCIQRMSGIASYTNRLHKMIEHTKAKILDTRKTTPGFRLCEKWAVHIGGGENHRFGLDEMLLIKDNHIDAVGDIKLAIIKAKRYINQIRKNLKIIVEARNLKEVSQILEIGSIHRILLDNMPIVEMKKAIKIIKKQCETEASGNINEKNIISVAESGVDYISIGALTHSVKSLNMSLKIFT